MPPVRSQPRRHEHRRRCRRSSCSRTSIARAAAARRIYAELAGYASDARRFTPTAPEPEGRPVAAVDRRRPARTRASTPPTWITSTRTARPRRRTMRRRRAGFAACSASASARLPVTSIKSMIGHCLGAAGAVEAAALALTIARGVIPPTIHHEETDPIVWLTSSPMSRASSPCAAASRRRWDSGETTPQS